MTSQKKLNKAIDLSKLPVKLIGKRRVVDWKSINNHSIEFEYANVKGILNLTYSHTTKGSSNQNMHYCKASYNGKEVLICDSNLRAVKIGALLVGQIEKPLKTKGKNKCDSWINRPLSKYKYNLGETLIKDTGKVKIIRRYRNKNRKNKTYELECQTCKNTFEKEESELKSLKCCPYCINARVKKGFNDAATTHPWLLKYVVNKHIIEKVSYGSSEKVVVQCPDCKSVKNIELANLVNTGFSCSCHSSSKGEQLFEACLLEQKIPYEREYIIKGRKRYDFYLPEQNTIVEIHGQQHYKEVSLWGDLKKNKLNDALKKDIAIEEGYEYVVLDWSHNSPKKLLKEIADKLPFFSKIDVQKNIEIVPRYKQFLDTWKEHPYDNELIEKKLKIGATTRKKLFKQLKELGMIDIDYTLYSRTKSIINLNERKVFLSIGEASEYYGVYRKSLVGNCENNKGNETRYKSAGKHPITKEKLQWMYYEDYADLYDTSQLTYIGDYCKEITDKQLKCKKEELVNEESSIA